MEQIDKNEYLNELFSYYGSLLTDKQQEYFVSYYQYDLSLFEIADEKGVSRNAVHDQLKIAEKHLYEFEEKLNLVKLSTRRKELLDKFEATKDLKYITELRKLDE
ncbi:YlxM family DNA-binding protein [Acholeplasma hippikon]|uniref:UPF0122 protein NCTC10172_00666 n=1 Tax=Acholeplasma hippikon TaxID=264636 RepID=A0A449BJK2_9MOLU|nr:hypothetical protein [Acholeplasma hippikon]VEU82646.1 helix-turn-helix protein, YlxM/p13 family [Acholeplasma hippikon]